MAKGLFPFFPNVLLFSIVQSADWHYGPTNTKSPQPAYVRKSALATMIFCFMGLIAYIGYLVSLFFFGLFVDLRAFCSFL